ncbi:MAG: hypothetical protein H6Q90_4387 [Deltaproteobacteria bacterium]|nr:hypothetical protein [Deltaproteobacteria bacterium]
MWDARQLVHGSVLIAALGSCGGGKKLPQPPAPVAKPDSTDPTAPAKPDRHEAPAVAADHPPELFAPAWKRVGVGQTIHFSVAAIDQDLDETRVEVTNLPKSASFDAITQTVTWTPSKADVPRAQFQLQITQDGRGKPETKTWAIDVDPKPQPEPVAEPLTPIIETVLMIRQPRRLEQVNKDWPLDKMLLVGAQGFKYQFPEDKRTTLAGALDKKVLFEGFLTGLAQTHGNPRLDPKSPKFDKAVFGDPASWKIVAVRPRIDRAWTEMRIVYQAVKAAEPTFAMFRLRPTVEYVPALPRPPQERLDNNKVFLGMVTKHLLPNGAPSDKLMKDQVAHGKAVAALVTELMTYDGSKTQPYLRAFAIGIATEARMGGGSARNPDGSYKSGDGWAWSAMKPFQTADGKSQQYVNVIIPGFWTKTQPTEDGKSWGPVCAPKFTAGAPGHVPGYEVLCRKTLGFVDLPDTTEGKVKGSRIDANQLFRDHKRKDMVVDFPLEDGRRDLGEENGMTCSQCHIRNFGMHDYSDPANVDPSKGVPKTRNKPLATLNFQIIPGTHWEEFTIEFLHHQECRGKQRIEETLGADAAKGLTCPLAK